MYKRYLKKLSYSYSLGTFPTIELLKHKPETVREILLHSQFTEQKNEGYNIITALAEKKRINTRKSDRNIEKLSPKGNCYVTAVFNKYQCRLAEDDHLVLVRPENKGNLGSIIRTMLAFGTKNLAVIEPAADYFDPQCVRASMGALFSINIKSYSTIEDYLSSFPGKNIYLMMTGAKHSLTDLTFKRPSAIVFGSESSGLPDCYSSFGQPVRIEHSRQVDSLNLSTAVSITLHYQMHKNQLCLK